MRTMLLVDATDLVHWADRRDAQALLPELVRRLVFATGQRVTRASFRSGEGVQLPGWDGVVVAEGAGPFVPPGLSGWELGVGRDTKRKADEDYRKRTGQPGEIDRAKATFVFVTPRRWAGTEAWAAARRNEGVWADVRAYDADDLAAWLEQAPAVHLWFSALLGKRPEDSLALETFYEDWAGATRPPIPPALLLAGREGAVRRIYEWVRGEPGQLALQAESREEAVAVAAAAFHRLPDEERDNVLARAVVVRTEQAVHDLAARESPLILAMALDSVEAVTHATRRGHHVLVPVGRERTPGSDCCSIPRITVEEAAAALMDVRVPEGRARALALLARRSFMAFRRKHAVSPELQEPPWAGPQHGPALLPAMLAGTWKHTSAGDREALARLGGLPYEGINAALARWANEPDPPVRRVGDVWYLVSREDAWRLLARYVDGDVLSRFEDVVIDVLGTPDPRFDLPETERYMANVLGKSPRSSPDLCRGLADGLAVMATSTESPEMGGWESLEAFVAWLVQTLLQRANADWRIWASLSEWGALPLLAEAAPDAFLSAVDAGLAGADPVLLKLFAKDDGGLFVSSPHTGLLWALETLAWSAEHLGYAAQLLARLARLDPGGRLANRPQNSLRAIFLPWFPQTNASAEQRLAVLDALDEKEPDVARPLMVQLLPKDHDVQFPTAKPSWREWCTDSERGVSLAEYLRTIRDLVTRLTQQAGHEGRRWKDLVEAAPSLPPDLRRLVIEGLERLEPASLPDPDRSATWNALREVLCRHRSYPEAEWALPGEDLDRLDAIMRRFAPRDLLARYAWLFGHHPALPEGRERNWRESEEEVHRRQVDAAAEVYAEGGIAALVSLAEGVECPDLVGFAFARTEGGRREEEHLLATYLAAQNDAHGQFARGFSSGRISVEGRDWAHAKARAEASRWTFEQQAEFLVCLPADARTWELVRSLGPDCERGYWQRIQPYGIDRADVERAARSFLEHGRPAAAVNLLADHEVGPASLAADALEALASAPADTVSSVGTLAYQIGQLLDRLQEASEFDRSRVARLEWACLPLLHHDRKPRVLHEELARSPEFFVEVLCWIFRAEGEAAMEVSEEARIRARLGYDLLHSWRTVPGDSGDGSVDHDAPVQWVRRARELLQERGRGEIGDEMIGQMLSGAPPGDDGAWPHQAVRDLIEEIASMDLERGIEVGRYNSRGVVWRSPYAGGEQERQIAAGYERDACTVAARWPRTAAMLRRMAKVYQADAAREDREAELRQDLER